MSALYRTLAAVAALATLTACGDDRSVNPVADIADARANTTTTTGTFTAHYDLIVGQAIRIVPKTTTRISRARWTTTSSEIARISSTGTVTGRSAGVAIVTMSGSGVLETYEVAVTDSAPTVTSFSLQPKTGVTVNAGQSQQFATNTTWSDAQSRPATVTYTATGGTISSTGLFTAGNLAGTFMVIATCACKTPAIADTSLVSVVVPQLTSLTVSPKTVSLSAGAAQQFTVSAQWSTGATTVPPVTWSATGGSVSASGLYTAPAAAGTYRVIVAHTNGTVRDTANVTVGQPASGPIGGSWQLAPGQFMPAKMPMLLVYPRPDAETRTTARHRRAYPGIEYRIPVAVQGGAYPFRFDLVSGPAGMTIGSTISDPNYGVVRWVPTSTGGPFSVTVRVTDQQGAIVNANYTVTATTQGFVFMDPAAPAGGSGTISSPLRNFSELLKGSRTDRTFAGQILYLRGGTHQMTGLPENNGNVNFGADNKPLAWLGYPGENVVLDASSAVVNFTESGSGLDLFVQGFTMRNSRPDVADSRFFFFGDGAGHRSTFFEMRFENLVRGTAGNDNPGAIVMFRGSSARNYFTVMNSSIDRYAAPMVGSIYFTRGAVIEGNTLGSASGSLNSGIYPKSGNDLWSIRRNISTASEFNYGAIQFTFDSGEDLRAEVSYNTLRVPSGGEMALVYNWGSTSTAGSRIWIYRNTVIGAVRALRNGSYQALFENNLIFNNIGGWSEWTTTPAPGNNNVVASLTAVSQYLGASWLLRDSYRSLYFGTHGAEIPSSR